MFRLPRAAIVRQNSKPIGRYIKPWFYVPFYRFWIWPDDGCTVQPKHVAVLYNKIRCTLTEFYPFLIVYTSCTRWRSNLRSGFIVIRGWCDYNEWYRTKYWKMWWVQQDVFVRTISCMMCSFKGIYEDKVGWSVTLTTSLHQVSRWECVEV
jgi:hypothetical protein